MKRRTPNLDSMLTLTECAVWLQISERELSLKARLGKIPAVRIGRLWRFHPRTIVSELHTKKSPIANRK